MNDTQTASGPLNLRVTFDNAMQHFQAGRLNDAKLACREIIAADPAHVDAIHLLGLIFGISGEHAAAMDLIGRAIQLKRGNVPAQFHNNLGLSLRATGQLDTAVEQFRQALSIKPDLPEAYANLGLVYQEQDKLDEAIKHFNQVTLLRPTSAEAFYQLAGALHQNGRISDAVACYNKTLSLSPGYAQAHNDLGAILRDQGRLEEAASRYERAINLAPDGHIAHFNLGLVLQQLGRGDQAMASLKRAAELGSVLALHQVAVLTGETAEQPPQGYIETLFDSYAPRFEKHLVEGLRYDAPQTLQRMVAALEPGARYKKMLDIGCGTGLSGLAFKGLSGQMTGVDLSPMMIRKAAGKNIYTRLEVSDAVAFIEHQADTFDLFVAADVLIYMGGLDTLFAAVAARANKGAKFVFTAEISDGPDYLLQSTGHYAHSQTYIEAELIKAGGKILSWETHPIRMHLGAAVNGHHVIAAFD